MGNENRKNVDISYQNCINHEHFVLTHTNFKAPRVIFLIIEREKQNFCAVRYTIKELPFDFHDLLRQIVEKLRIFRRCFFREGEAKFLCCSLYYEGALSIMEPVEFSRISF